MAGQPEEEEEVLRVDPTDGLAYPLKDWLVQYGGSPENPPMQWLNARIAPSTKVGFGAPGQEKKAAFSAVPSNQPSAPPASEFEVETFIADNSLDQRAARLLREQKPDVQTAVIAGGPLRMTHGNIANHSPIALMMSRIKVALGSGDDSMEWNPNGGGKHSGVVKMWHDLKGYGFITDAADGIQYFCHNLDIGRRSLIKDGHVTFDLGENTNGSAKAINVSGAVGPRIGPEGKFGKGKGKGKGLGGNPIGNLIGGPPGMGGNAVDVDIENYVIIPFGWMPGMKVRFEINGTKYSVPVPPGKVPGQHFMINL